MFATVPSIATRLTAALGAGWDVATGNQSADRRALPRADVRVTTLTELAHWLTAQGEASA